MVYVCCSVWLITPNEIQDFLLLIFWLLIPKIACVLLKTRSLALSVNCQRNCNKLMIPVFIWATLQFWAHFHVYGDWCLIQMLRSELWTMQTQVYVKFKRLNGGFNLVFPILCRLNWKIHYLIPSRLHNLFFQGDLVKHFLHWLLVTLVNALKLYVMKGNMRQFFLANQQYLFLRCHRFGVINQTTVRDGIQSSVCTEKWRW